LVRGTAGGTRRAGYAAATRAIAHPFDRLPSTTLAQPHSGVGVKQCKSNHIRQEKLGGHLSAVPLGVNQRWPRILQIVADRDFDRIDRGDQGRLIKDASFF